MVDRKCVVAIDNDGYFLDQMQMAFDDSGILSDYDFVAIEARAHGQIEQVVESCVQEVRALLDAGRMIEAVFIDVVIDERVDEPTDMSGVEIARRLRGHLPCGVPLLCMTRFHKAAHLIERLFRTPYVDAVVVKDTITEEISRREFGEIIASVREKKRVLEDAGAGREAVLGVDDVQGRFKIHGSARCQQQAESVGVPRLKVLLERMFPESTGTVSYLRPGFSGSYLFEVAESRPRSGGKSGRKTRVWAVKLSSDRQQLTRELDNAVRVKNSVPSGLYPDLYRDRPVEVGSLAAIAFEMKRDMSTLEEHVQSALKEQQVTGLVDDCVGKFLRKHYADSQQRSMQQDFLWAGHFELSSSKVAAILSFLDECESRADTAINSLCGAAVNEVRAFVEHPPTHSKVTGYSTVPGVANIHGDLNARNILVSQNQQKAVFIDFAHSGPGHYAKDIARLETDLVFLALDRRGFADEDLGRIPDWLQLMPLFSADAVARAIRLTGIRSSTVKQTARMVNRLRLLLPELIEKAKLAVPDHAVQYLMALLYYQLSMLAYQDISSPKKVFCLMSAKQVLDELDGML